MERVCTCHSEQLCAYDLARHCIIVDWCLGLGDNAGASLSLTKLQSYQPVGLRARRSYFSRSRC